MNLIFMILLNLVVAPKDHPNFDELYLARGTKMINEYQETEIESYYEEIKPKFFGYESYIITDGDIIEYTSRGDFSYTNDGEVDYVYEKSGQKKRLTKASINVSADLSIKADMGIKKLATKLGANVKASATGDYSSQESVEERYNLKVRVKPHTKVTERVRGKARLTNGVSKRFMMFIETKKGVFEIIEPISETTWMMEEYI